ncbi:MAG: UbiH/UbiF family hydroxylase [Wenzhouxiangellaceae bacterium]
MSRVDALIVGGATVGASAACALARLGWRVALLDRSRAADAPDGADMDPRVVALSPGGRRLLQGLGIWQRLDPKRIAPFERMRVESGGRILNFDARDEGLDALGWIVELPALDHAACASATHEGVEILRPAQLRSLRATGEGIEAVLEDDRTIHARLALAADGKHSQVRAWAGIPVHSHDYNQRAIVTHLSSRRPNPGVAWQHFGPAGPLALLPLPDGRSSLVWSVHRDFAQRMLALDDEQFCTTLEAHAGDHPFGGIHAAGRRLAFPLAMHRARHFASGRIALIGDAARCVHPLAGQGLNLGLTDVAALIEVLGGLQPSADPVRALQRYARRRQSDSTLITAGIHAFNELRAFGPAARAALGLGFELLNRVAPARAPFLHRALGLREAEAALARLS